MTAPSDPKALAERLRCYTKGWHPGVEEMREQAADLIDSLTTRLAEVERERDASKDLVIRHSMKIMEQSRDLHAAERDLAEVERALSKINDIRNSIVGLQTINWSEHIYPLVAALDEAGINGMGYPEARGKFGTMLERTLAAERDLAEVREALDELDRYSHGLPGYHGSPCEAKVRAALPAAPQEGNDG